MARRAVRLTPDHLSALPDEVSTHLRWKVDAVTLARLPEAEHGTEVEAWLSEVLREWGSCGRVVEWDDRPVGVLVHCPPAFLPGLGEVPTAPPSPDAVVVADLFVLPEARGAGVGRMLVQAVARDLVERGVPALEAFGSRPSPVPPLAGQGSRGRDAALVPAEFYGAVGFRTHRTHSTTPRLRMELRATRTWKSEVESALERLVGAVRPAMEPGATPRRHGQTVTRVRSDPRAP